jgi:hypothetical protein
VTRLPAPASITATMHAHQLDGLSWMAHMYSHGMPMILGDQVSCQLIAHILIHYIVNASVRAGCWRCSSTRR